MTDPTTEAAVERIMAAITQAADGTMHADAVERVVREEIEKLTLERNETVVSLNQKLWNVTGERDDFEAEAARLQADARRLDDRLKWWRNDFAYKAPEQIVSGYVEALLADIDAARRTEEG